MVSVYPYVYPQGHLAVNGTLWMSLDVETLRNPGIHAVLGRIWTCLEVVLEARVGIEPA